MDLSVPTPYFWWSPSGRDLSNVYFDRKLAAAILSRCYATRVTSNRRRTFGQPTSTTKTGKHDKDIGFTEKVRCPGSAKRTQLPVLSPDKLSLASTRFET